MAEFNILKSVVTNGKNKIAYGDGGPNTVAYHTDVLGEVAKGVADNTIPLTTTGGVVATGTEVLLGSLIGANFNVTTDQAIPITRIGTKKYLITKIVVTNASTSLTAADGGIYTATSKGGTAIVAAAQVYTALTSATVALNLTLAVNNTYTLDNIYLSLTGAQGGAATADVYVFGIVLP